MGRRSHSWIWTNCTWRAAVGGQRFLGFHPARLPREGILGPADNNLMWPERRHPRPQGREPHPRLLPTKDDLWFSPGEDM
eukprot:6378470-Alexandrium_andersonii.AAC.1